MEKKVAVLVNIGYYGFFIILVFLVWEYVLPVMMPFVLAFILSSMLRRPSRWISKKTGFSWKVTAAILLILFYVLFFGAAFSGGGKTASAIGDFIMRLPQTYQKEIAPILNSVLEKIGNMLPETGFDGVGQIEDSLRQLIQNLGQTISTLSMNILSAASEYIAGIPGMIVRVVITVVSSFYISVDYDRISETVRKYLPIKVKKIGGDIKKYGVNMLKVYLKSYFLLFVLTFTELTVGFFLLRIPYPVVVALAIAVFDILPVLGTGGILLPWMAVMAVTGNYPMAVGLMLIYIAITVIRNILEPKIVGRQIGLHPLVTLIAMFAGMSLCGLPGLILFPMAVVIFINMGKNGALHWF